MAFIVQARIHRRAVDRVHHASDLLIVVRAYLHMINVVLRLRELQALLVEAHFLAILEQLFDTDQLRASVGLWVE